MTPEEISAINKRIAEWSGIDSHDCDENAFHCDDCARGSIQTPDYFRTNAAMDLLGVLVDKGYAWSLDGDTKEVYCGVSRYDTFVLSVVESTIPAAICRACLGVAEREGKE